MPHAPMRSLMPLVLLTLTWCSAVAQSLPAKFVSDDGALALFLGEDMTEAHLMLGYGFLFPVEATLAGEAIEGTIGAEITLTGVPAGDALRLTLRRADVEETLTLSRQRGGTAPPSDDALLALLRLVPDTPNARLGGIPGVGYADVAAALALASGPRPTTREAFDALEDGARDGWTTAFRRLQTGPQDLLSGALTMIASMDDLLGFEWFAIEQALGYGRPPDLGVVLAAEVEPDRLGERLARRDFAAAALDGVTVWHRNEDGRVNLAERAPGDPFVGPMGMAARIAVLPGHLVGTRFWSMTRDVVGTAVGRYPSLADALDYRTLAHAALEGDGALIQAQFLGPLDAGFVAADPFAILRDGTGTPAPEGHALPPYGLAILADRQEGPDQVSLIALLYPDAATAAAAAAVLSDRMAGFAPETVAGWGARVDPPRVHAGERRIAAAVASIRYPRSTAAAQGAPPGGAFTMWLRALVNRDLALLRIGP
jgi:hypothetical protein